MNLNKLKVVWDSNTLIIEIGNVLNIHKGKNA